VISLPRTILHLDKVLMVIGPGQVLYCEELISERDIKGFEGIGISCEGAVNANIICLGDRELIIDRSNSLVMDRLETEKYIVHKLDLGEFIRGKGGPNCLIMPIERGA
jgi:N-dimethylarginine dimethylaminohydrolase